MCTKDISFWAIWSHNSSYQTQTLISGALCTRGHQSGSKVGLGLFRNSKMNETIIESVFSFFQRKLDQVLKHLHNSKGWVWMDEPCFHRFCFSVFSYVVGFPFCSWILRLKLTWSHNSWCWSWIGNNCYCFTCKVSTAHHFNSKPGG